MIDEDFGLSEKEEQKKEVSFATISEITQTGIKLIIDGSDEAGEKEYKCNAGVNFEVGDRVKISKKSGTYVVEFPIGNPNSRGELPSGGTNGQVLTKNATGGVEWKTQQTYNGPTINGIGTSTIGFFGHVASRYQSVNRLTSYNTYTSSIGQKINDIIDALKAYGLL